MNLLLIAYEFPPSETSEAIRSLKTIRYLPEYFDQIHVITREIKDKSKNITNKEFSEKVHIHSIPDNYQKINKIFRILGTEYYFWWIILAIIKGKKVIKDEKIDIILSRSYPISSHIVAYYLKKNSNLPWVGDFSDPWTQNPYRNYPTKLLKIIDKKIEKKILQKMDRIVVITNYLKQLLLEEYHFLSTPKVKVIPNAYDSKEYEQFLVNKGNDFKSSKFTITYSGSFYGKRSPESFFRSLYEIKKKNIEIYKNIEVVMIGPLGKYKYLIDKYDLTDIVTNIDHVPHDKVFEYLYHSDSLLLIDAPMSPNMFMPAKLAEYLFIGKSIIAITPLLGESADIINATDSGKVISPHDIKGITNTIEDYYYKHQRNELITKPNKDLIVKYDVKVCAEELVKIMKELI